MNLKTILLTVMGVFLLGLGAVGVFVPVLPTTPFVIVAAACFSGTPRLQRSIRKAPLFREYFKHYQTGEGIPVRTGVLSLVFLWGMLGISIFLTEKLWLTRLLLGIGVAVTIHILWMTKSRTKKDSEREG